MKYYEIIVKNLIQQEKAYNFLKSSNFSEHYIKALRNTPNAILINNKTAIIKDFVKNGDSLKILNNPFKKTDIKLIDSPLEIVYEDENVLLVNKPSLLATMPSRSHYDKNLAGMICNYMAIKDNNYTLRVFNRLDKEASGLILVSKDAISHQRINSIEKEYHAICYGNILETEVVDKPILTINNFGINEMKRICSPLGQKAKTTFIPIKQLKDKTLVKVKIYKGRTHQIRLHASYISHSLIGDQIYGDKDEYTHAFLCLKKLSFHNDITNKDYTFEIDYPDDFKNILNIN